MELIEREVKFYLLDPAAMVMRLEATGADLIRQRTLERNLRFDLPDGSLFQAKRILRLRQDDRVRMTYKDNAGLENGVLARTEIEFTADNFEITRKFFEALGYQVVVIYEKYRQVYKVGDVEVVLDELPFGNFMEIEAPNATLIEGVAQMLGLDWSKRIFSGYLVLFENMKHRRDLPFRDLTFENFSSIKITPEDLEVEAADI